jgi:hypothetical protein
MAYALFAGERYYPAGGMDDLIGVFDMPTEAQARFYEGYDESSLYDWGHIVDTDTFKKVLVWAVVTPGKRATKTRPAQLEVMSWVDPVVD